MSSTRPRSSGPSAPGPAERSKHVPPSTEDLFQCDHYDAAGAPELAYSFSLPNGKYVVNLFFANTQLATSLALTRVFDLRVEGATVYNNFDQVAATGGNGKVADETFRG